MPLKMSEFFENETGFIKGTEKGTEISSVLGHLGNYT